MWMRIEAASSMKFLQKIDSVDGVIRIEDLRFHKYDKFL